MYFFRRGIRPDPKYFSRVHATIVVKLNRFWTRGGEVVRLRTIRLRNFPMRRHENWPFFGLDEQLSSPSAANERLFANQLFT